MKPRLPCLLLVLSCTPVLAVPLSESERVPFRREVLRSCRNATLANPKIADLIRQKQLTEEQVNNYCECGANLAAETLDRTLVLNMNQTGDTTAYQKKMQEIAKSCAYTLQSPAGQYPSK